MIDKGIVIEFRMTMEWTKPIDGLCIGSKEKVNRRVDILISNNKVSEINISRSVAPTNERINKRRSERSDPDKDRMSCIGKTSSVDISTNSIRNGQQLQEGCSFARSIKQDSEILQARTSLKPNREKDRLSVL
jgi:hypothetical protein